MDEKERESVSKKADRKSSIMQMLQETPSLHIAELATYFNVAEMTVRRDIHELKKLGFVEQRLGVVFPAKNSARDTMYRLYQEALSQTEAKEKISRFASSLIESNDSIIIDAGSTTERMVKYLPNTPTLMIICYNYNILEQVIAHGHENVLFLGGFYHPFDQTFVAPASISLLESVRANTVFFSASGVHQSLGITCGHNYNVPIKKTAYASSSEKILLVDSTKFGKVAGSYFAQLEEMDTVITDSGIPDTWRTYIRDDLGKTLYVVDE